MFHAFACGLPDEDLADGTARPVTAACQQPVIQLCVAVDALS